MSDIHFKNTKKEKKIIEKLCDDINKQNKEIDLFIISGDLVNRGGENFEDLQCAFLEFEYNFIEKIKKHNIVKNDQIFICPGNHDVDRSLIDEYSERGIRETFREGQDSIDDFMHKAYINIDKGIERMKPYKEYEESFYSNQKCKKLSNFESNFKINIKNKKIGISSLNSCWRCTEKDEDLFLGYEQLDRSIDFISDCEIKIAIMHHSYEFLNNLERKKIRDNIEKNYDYIFLGHVHNMQAYNIEGLRGNIFTSVAQSHSISNEKNKEVEYTMGYSIIEIDEENSRIILYNRRYNSLKNEYTDNYDLLGLEGKKQYTLFTNEQQIENRKINDIITKIEEDYFCDFNEHLLSYKTDSKAPKTINEIFVTPRIIDKSDYDLEERYNLNKQNEEKLYSIEELISMDENIIIAGTKESGKTILLDKIAIYLVDYFEQYRMIPIKMELHDYKLEKNIATYLGIKKSELDSFIENNKIALIIDNINFTEEDSKKLNSIKLFIEKYENIKIICSCKIDRERQFPVEIINDEIFSKFHHFYIDMWKSLQIKELINTWFLDSENKDLKVDDIANIFNNIKITMNPLNISMFLWVIEHESEYKLINTSKLMECFFEHLLEKLKLEELYYGEFDYTNKKRLLANIAYEMYKKKIYKLEYQELYSYVYEYIKKKKFSVRNDKLLQYFFDRGILVRQQEGQNDMVAFRFECFFRFFLMQYMLINKEFKEEVLKKENYLNFENEIVYYTGLQRDDEDLLKMLYERMMNEFKGIKDEIENIKKKKENLNYDYFFETSESLTECIDIENLNPIEKDIEDSKNDKIIESVNKEAKVGHVKDIDNNSSLIRKLYTIWRLVAKVLRNTEEIENDIELKNIVYKDVIECSILSSIVYKRYLDILITTIYDQYEDKTESRFFKELVIESSIIPAMHQYMLGGLLATNKLKIVAQEEIEKVFKNIELSDLEKFMHAFLLFNIDKASGINYINILVRKTKKNYIRDMIFIELMRCYRFNEKNEILDGHYLNIMGDIIEKTKKGQERFTSKGKFITKMKNTKLIESQLINM